LGNDRLALYTAVYPGVEPYLGGWYASVLAQTDPAFDLWISVDGLTREQVVAAMGAEPDAHWSFAPPGTTPAAIRSAGLGELTEHYAGVVLVDSDDLLEPSRVASARDDLDRADVVGCALRLVDAAGSPLGPVLAPATPEPDWSVLLSRHNVFGLSNTAYRTATLRCCLPVPAETVLIDWLLILRACSVGATVRFDLTPRMRYRQHQANVARVVPPFTEEYVLRATDLVLDHYRQLLGPAGRVSAGCRGLLLEAGKDATAFRQAVGRSNQLLRRYVGALNAMPPRYVWWWCVANPELEELWKN
jgi:hypothetical protein